MPLVSFYMLTGVKELVHAHISDSPDMEVHKKISIRSVLTQMVVEIKKLHNVNSDTV